MWEPQLLGDLNHNNSISGLWLILLKAWVLKPADIELCLALSCTGVKPWTIEVQGRWQSENSLLYFPYLKIEVIWRKRETMQCSWHINAFPLFTKKKRQRSKRGWGDQMRSPDEICKAGECTEEMRAGGSINSRFPGAIRLTDAPSP